MIFFIATNLNHIYKNGQNKLSFLFYIILNIIINIPAQFLLNFYRNSQFRIQFKIITL